MPAADRPDEDRLTDTLRDAQRVGFLGDRPIPLVIEHAEAFVTALGGVTGTVLDLGSGGGVPGLVIAVRRPDLRVVLLDRRSKRTDFLELAVARLGLGSRVTVRCADVRTVLRQEPARYAAVVARGFGPPSDTLRWARRLVDAGGRIVISEPPEGQRWPPELLDELALTLDHRGTVAVFSPRSPA